jgi:hypothetical protein
VNRKNHDDQDVPVNDADASPEEVRRLLQEAAARRERRKPYMRAYMAKRRARLKEEAGQ